MFTTVVSLRKLLQTEQCLDPTSEERLRQPRLGAKYFVGGVHEGT